MLQKSRTCFPHESGGLYGEAHEYLDTGEGKVFHRDLSAVALRSSKSEAWGEGGRRQEKKVFNAENAEEKERIFTADGRRLMMADSIIRVHLRESAVVFFLLFSSAFSALKIFFSLRLRVSRRASAGAAGRGEIFCTSNFGLGYKPIENKDSRFRGKCSFGLLKIFATGLMFYKQP